MRRSWAAYEAFERAAGLVQNADDVQARAAAAREAWEGRQTLAAGAGAELPATGLLPGPLLAAGAAAQAAVRRQQQARARASLGDTLRAEYGEVRPGARAAAPRRGGGGGGGSGGSGGGGGSGGSGGGAIYAEPESSPLRVRCRETDVRLEREAHL